MSKQFTIIDGYNVLHQFGLIGDRVGPGSLRRARGLIVGLINQHLESSQLAHTTIVFDSSIDSPDSFEPPAECGIQILFAWQEPEADDLIEALIDQHSAPKQLLVVSSDHRLQKSARRRGARFVDSDIWLDQLVGDGTSKESNTRESSRDLIELIRDRKLDDASVNKWLKEFGIGSELSEEVTSEQDNSNMDKESAELETTTWNPFPSGYAEELFVDDDESPNLESNGEQP